MKLRHLDTWHTVYREIPIKIVNHSKSKDEDGFGRKNGIWCGYLLLDQKHHPEILGFLGTAEEVRAAGGLVDIERAHSFWDSLPFHGGVTFYKETKDAFGRVLIEVGCDYAHYGDDDVDYGVEWILMDMQRIVNEYREKFPLVTQ